MEELLCASEDRSDDERAGQRLPTLPEGGKQARLDVGTLQNESFPLFYFILLSFLQGEPCPGLCDRLKERGV